MTGRKRYLRLLDDELQPFGLVRAAAPVAEAGTEVGRTVVCYEADPVSFVTTFAARDIRTSYGRDWPPAALRLWLRITADGDVIEVTFETHDLLAWAAGTKPRLAARLTRISDPADHAAAVAEALSGVLAEPEPEPDPWC